MPSTLVDSVVEHLLKRIVAEEFDGRPLPREQDLADKCEVSRLTLREAVQILVAAGVLRIERGRGTYVNPIDTWQDVGLVARATGDTADTSLQLLETRRLIEVGAIQLAAQRLKEPDLDEIGACLDQMVTAHAEGDVETFAAADLDFHRRILQGTGNPFIPVLYGPIVQTLRYAREETSSFSEVREHAIGYHRDILTALRSGDVTAAKDAMTAHLVQTRNDLQHYVLDADQEDEG